MCAFVVTLFFMYIYNVCVQFVFNALIRNAHTSLLPQNTLNDISLPLLARCDVEKNVYFACNMLTHSFSLYVSIYRALPSTYVHVIQRLVCWPLNIPPSGMFTLFFHCEGYLKFSYLQAAGLSRWSWLTRSSRCITGTDVLRVATQSL